MVASADVVLQAHQVRKVIQTGNEQLVILHDVALDIKAGESVAIVGASGSGKTTLLTLLAGLDVPASGTITLRGHNLLQLSEEARTRLRARDIGFIFQNFYLLPALTTLENVMLPLELQGVASTRARMRAQEWLTRVALAHRLHHYPAQLSGGEQQRTAIARAFITEPAIVFADEMTGNLDEATAAHMVDLLFQLNQQQQTTLVIVTHDRTLAARCTRILRLHNGILQPCEQ